MKMVTLLFVISLFINGVFYKKSYCAGVFGAGKGKSVSVIGGESVTLLTDVPDVKKHDVIRWRFRHENSPLAELDRTAGIFSIHDDVHDGIFKNRLQLDHQTGSLTITNIRNTDSGVYELDISNSSTHTIHQSITVTVCALGLSLGAVAGICFTFLLIAAVTVAVIYYRLRFHWIDKCWDKMESVLKGGSVTLHTDLTDIQSDDEIEWRFGPQEVTIAKSTKGRINYFDERFRDRLTLNQKTGDLSIKDITNEQSGFYRLKTIKNGNLSSKKFYVIVIGKVMTVNAGESVTLETHVTEIQRDEKIEWMFGDKESIIAQIDSAFDIFYTCDGGNDVFNNTLELDHQTGDLTIKNIRKRHAGVYTLKTILSGNVSFRRLRVIVTGVIRKIQKGDLETALVV
ncbi:uncharacterized protein [Misgurnus anguillicaudatus]|uniref:uncharacterized protein n=1 Tax=Misgurnus anguillicaudatus TaxID=75329 RepID=UPI003CCF2E77